MKKILILFFVLAGIAGKSQYIKMTAYGYEEKRHKADSVEHVPVINDSLLHTTDTSAQIRIIDGNIYWHYGYWRPFVSAGTNGVDTIWRIPGVDSIYFSISGRDHAILDSSSGKLNISDTTGHWVYDVYKRSDSFFYAKNGMEFFIGLDSAGTTLQTATNGVPNSTQTYLNFQNSGTVVWTESGGTMTAEVPAATDNHYAIEDNVGLENRLINYEGYNHEEDSLGEMNYNSGDKDLLKAASNIHLDSNAASYYSQLNDTTKAMLSTLNSGDSSQFLATATDNINFLSMSGSTHGLYRIDITHPSNVNSLYMNKDTVWWKTGTGKFEVTSGDLTYTTGSTGDFNVQNDFLGGGSYNSNGSYSELGAYNDGHFVINTTDSIFTPFYATTNSNLFFQPTSTGGWRLAEVTPVDTTSLSNRIDHKVDTIYRTPGKDSIQFTIGGRYHAIKDSTGGAATTYFNSNIGLGYRWAVPNTNNIKTAFGGFAVVIDSTTNTNGLTFKVDTSTTGIHTENYFNTKYQGLLSIGAFNNTSTANSLDLTANVLTAHAADGTNAGGVSVVDQTLGKGKKAFTNLVQYGSTTSAAATLTLDSTYTYWTNTGGSVRWTLPAVSGRTGWVFKIKNRGTDHISLIRSGTDKIYKNSQLDSFFIYPGESYTVENDGTFWDVSVDPGWWIRGRYFLDLLGDHVVQLANNGDTVLIGNDNVKPAKFNVNNGGVYVGTLGISVGNGNASSATVAYVTNNFPKAFFSNSVSGASNTAYNADFGLFATGTTAVANTDVYRGVRSFLSVNNSGSTTQTADLFNAFNATFSLKGSSTTPITNAVGYDVTTSQVASSNTQTITNLYNYKANIGTYITGVKLITDNGSVFGYYMDSVGQQHVQSTGVINYGYFQRTNVNYDSIYNVWQGSSAFGKGVTTPNSTLQVNGSFSNAYVAKTGNYTATVSDHTIEFTANADTLTVPTAVGITGREYEVVVSGANDCQIATTSSQTFVNINGTPTTLKVEAVGAGKITSYTIRSNGANWLVVGKVKNE